MPRGLRTVAAEGLRVGESRHPHPVVGMSASRHPPPAAGSRGNEGPLLCAHGAAATLSAVKSSCFWGPH